MRRTVIFLGVLMGLISGDLFLAPTPRVAAQGELVGVYTHHGDNMRTGWNARETQLSPATVNTARFGRLWGQVVDGQVYAQPLLVPAVDLGAAGVHNLVFVATEHNSVYAFDAETGGAPLWQAKLGPSVPNSSAGVPCGDIQGPEYGITGTPVIDPATRALYVVAKTRENSQQIYRLHALEISSGQERAGWPVVIEGRVAGNGGGSVGGQIAFDPRIQLQRAGLLLLNGRVVIAFGAHCDIQITRYHGWVFSYNTANPAEPPQIVNTTPEQSPGPFAEAAAGIWQSGFGLAADDGGNIYFETGNGLINADQGGRNVGDSFVRLTTASGILTFTPDAANFFTPSNERFLDQRDLDLGSGGAMVIPDQPGTTTPRLVVGGSKQGAIYLLNRDFLGGFTGRVNASTLDRAVQTIPNPGSFPTGVVYGGPAYWEGPGGNYLFFTSARNPIRRYRLGPNPNGTGGSWLIPDGETADRFGRSGVAESEKLGPTPVVSSSGQMPGTGIVWVLRRDDHTLRAYSTDTMALLWHSGQASADTLSPSVVKFTVPIVANGKVYVGTRTSVICYGLRANQ